MQNEVGAAMHRRQHRHHAFLHRLAVGQFRCGEGPGTTQRKSEAARQLPHHHGADRRLRRAEGGRPRSQRHAGEKVAVDHRRARALELRDGAAHHGLRVRLGNGAGIRHRAHGATQDEGHDHGGLVGARIGSGRLGHGAVPQQGRVHVHVAQDHAVLVDEVGAEQQAAHGDRILRALLGRDRPHVGLVGILHVGVDHVQMALVYRHVGRLADRAAGVVQPGAGIRQLDEVLKVRQCAVAPAAVEVHHERRTIGRREHHAVAADLHRPRRVAGVLGELAWRGLEDLAQMPGLETHAHAVHLCAGLSEHRQAVVVVADVQPHLGQDAVGRRLDLQQALFTHDVVGGYGARDVGRRGGFGVRVAPLAAAAAVAFGISFAHGFGSSGGSADGSGACHMLSAIGRPVTCKQVHHCHNHHSWPPDSSNPR